MAQTQQRAGSAQYAGTARFASAADVRSSQQRPADVRQRSAENTYAQGTGDPRISAPPIVADTVSDVLAKLPPPTQWPSAALSFFVIDPMQAVLRMVIDVLVSPRTHRIVLRLSVLVTLFWTAFALAIAAYVGFYRAWVPRIGETRAVWLQYGQETPPYAVIDLSMPSDKAIGVFAEDQEYDVSLDLVVPMSAANLDLGNFMVDLELRSPLNHTVYRISKPSIIVHEPGPIRAMNNILFQLTKDAPAFILPTSSPPVQLMTIPLLQRSVLQPASQAHPFAAAVPEGVSMAIVTVGRHDADRYWRYGGGHGVGGIMQDSGGIVKAASQSEGFRSRGELQTHSASLRFDAHLRGLRYFMYHHPVASFVLFTSLFMAFELVSALTLWAIAAFYTSTMTQPSLGIEDNYLDSLQRRKGTGRSGSSPTDTDSTTARRSQADEGYGSDTVTADSELDDEGRSSGALSPSASYREGRTPSQRPTLSALQAQEAQQRREQRRGDLQQSGEGRMLSPSDPASTSPYDELGRLVDQPRRVLGRLDEETEEETDARSTATSAGWENLGDDDAGPRRYSPDAPEAQAQAQEGIRQRRTVKAEEEDDDGVDEGARFAREGTTRGSETSRSSYAPSFGATPRPSVTPGASSAAGPSRLPSEASTAVKREGSDESAELETDDSDEKGPARREGDEDGDRRRPATGGRGDGDDTPRGGSADDSSS